jgi:ribosomal protein L12E/L44/L45/RPP1/RPP2
MSKNDNITEQVATSKKTSTKDMSKYGKLSDPKESFRSLTPEQQEEFSDDSVGFTSNEEFNSIGHKKDPRYVDVLKEERKIKNWAKNSGKLSVEGKHVFAPVSEQSKSTILQIYQDMTDKFGNVVMEFADGSFRVRKAKTDISSPYAEFADLAVGKYGNDGMVLETADDDRVIGIPYTIANLGADKYYVINGRIYSGWSMWYGLQAIRSPEDYARNVDLAYNIPFVWAGFQLKSQLSLGATFDITHGTEEEVTPEENFLNETFSSRLKINVNKLAKTSIHLDIYGNAYWHIRRDANGFPDKITILMPERIKVFLDPKTTKVLYYIYLPPVLAGMALTPYPNIRENPNVMWGPALTYPTPIIIDPADIIHFKENDFTEYPFGLSACKAMIDPAQARMDINLIAPMIFKRYAKPFIHWKLDPMQPFQLTKGQIESYISGMKATLEGLEPMSDPITSTRWSANPVGAAQGKAELLTILQDLDNQIFACIGVSESYFKPQMGTDRMLAEQDKTLLGAMQQRQQMVGEQIMDKIIKPAINTYDRMINQQLVETGAPVLPDRMWNQYPTLQWRETFKQDQVSTIQNTLALLQAGLVDHARAARRVGEAPPQESAELARQQDLQKISDEVQIEQQKAAFLNAQLQQLDINQTIGMGGTVAVQMAQAAAAGQEPGAGKGEGSAKPGRSEGAKKAEGAQDNQMFKVTFINKQGKKQTERMKGSTLNKVKAGGVSIQNVEPVGVSSTGGDNAKKALG